MPQEGEYPSPHCGIRRSDSIMVQCHKKENIHYGAVSQTGEYPLWRCDTSVEYPVWLRVIRRRVSTLALCHEKESVTTRRKTIMAPCYKKMALCHKNESI